MSPVELLEIMIVREIRQRIDPMGCCIGELRARVEIGYREMRIDISGHAIGRRNFGGAWALSLDLLTKFHGGPLYAFGDSLDSLVRGIAETLKKDHAP